MLIKYSDCVERMIKMRIMGLDGKKEKRQVVICVMVIWLFFVWIISRTPYGIDDWSWGTSGGVEDFLSGRLNGRYVGNLLEIMVSRSQFLKTILIGI